ncbi:General transcription factor IIH subunit 5 [Tritrichomonas musculus]|uniref:General transcription and DNA repair factor IIH subunit TFB5 n=1 Tax=Tritrichomonas musculus TaxID=1915356 RepID=A0ABR2KKM8_9EUKA
MTEIGKKGELIVCSDEAIREYILNLNAEQAETQKFIIKDLPPKSLFVKKGSSPKIKEAINELINKITFESENR